jgi:SAM-dependent methyltransferase
MAAMQHNARNRAPFVVEALGTEGVRRILDLGGGPAIYSIAFARASSEVQCEILDLPAVVPLTREYLTEAGLSSRISVRTGDMLAEDLGSGWDLIMLNAICHMFSEEQNRGLFRRARRALAPKGRLAVQVAVPCSVTEVGEQETLTEVMVAVGGGGVPPPPPDQLLHPESVPKESRPKPSNRPGTMDNIDTQLLLLRMAISPIWIAQFENRHKLTTAPIKIQQHDGHGMAARVCGWRRLSVTPM